MNSAVYHDPAGCPSPPKTYLKLTQNTWKNFTNHPADAEAEKEAKRRRARETESQRVAQPETETETETEKHGDRQEHGQGRTQHCRITAGLRSRKVLVKKTSLESFVT